MKGSATTEKIDVESGKNRLEANKKLVLAFYDGAFNQRDLSVADTYVWDDYIQHNPMARTGKAGFVEAIGGMLKQFPNMKVTFKEVVAEGNLVVVHVWLQTDTTNTGDRGSAVFDMFRIKDGRIAEHWDVVQPIPENPANANGMV